VDNATNIYGSTRDIGITMALGSTQTLTEMSTSNVSWEVKAASA